MVMVRAAAVAQLRIMAADVAETAVEQCQAY